MNFNSFTDTNVELEPESIRDFCQHLLCGQAALQCSHDQPAIDLLVPMYRGDIKNKFDPHQLAVLVVQVKNKIKKTPLNVEKGKGFYQTLFGHRSGNPAIPVAVLAMDLSCPPLKDGTHVQACPSFDEHVFAFHLTGHTMETYKYVLEDTRLCLTKILNSERSEGKLQSKFSSQNLLFDRHSWSTRYAVGQSGGARPTSPPRKRAADDQVEDEAVTKKTKVASENV